MQNEVTKLIKTYKQNNVCICCRESESCCLEYHHLFDKKFSLSSKIPKNITKEDLIREMNKCVLLCSNCHRKLHAGVLDITDKFLFKHKINLVVSKYT